MLVMIMGYQKVYWNIIRIKRKIDTMDYTEAIKEYESKNIFFLTEFEKMVFKHAFEMGYNEGKVDGIKEGFCDAL
jgi:predicted metal-binding protein